MSVVTSPIVLELEELSYRAWPAEDVLHRDGWRLRFTHRVTRRANSVWPNASSGRRTLDDRIDAVEEFYGLRGAPPSFQISEAALPALLDERLAERGYAVESPVVIETMELARCCASPPDGRARVEVSARYGDDWLHLAVARGRFQGMERPYRGILDRIGERAGFAVARRDDEPVAMGLGVVDDGWLGVFGMATVEEARREGFATRVLAALSEWGRGRGALRAYLQVERDNRPARALYAAAGFRP